jgi:dTMP kinase
VVLSLVFVVLDGLDASGKSTQAGRLRRHLAGLGRTVYVRIHPSVDCCVGVMTRQFLQSEGKSAHFASAIFYILDVLRSVVRCPWWLYDYVVFVRYLMGTAYLPDPLNRIAYGFFAAILPRPRHKLFLDVDPEEAHRRIVENRSEREMFESLVQLRKVGGRALSLALVFGWTIIDANRPEEEVERQIISAIH